MAGVIPIIDTAYDIAISTSIRLIHAWRALFVEVPPEVKALPEASSRVDRPTSHVETSVGTDTSLPVAVPLVTARGKNTIMYVLAHETPLYRGPTIAFDSQCASIPYGSLVLAVEPHGRFYRVIWGTQEGWVLKEHLADRASLVYPEFVPGEENSIDHPNTARVRAVIGDAFGLAHSEFALQAGEYVLYKLLRRGIRIPWPPMHGSRTPGSWHTILRGMPGVHIAVTPKAGSILEYTEEHEIGHLAYVEAVFPDGMIAISEANHPDGGRYSERTLSRSTWHALKPVFIEIVPESRIV